MSITLRMMLIKKKTNDGQMNNLFNVKEIILTIPLMYQNLPPWPTCSMNVNGRIGLMLISLETPLEGSLS